MKMNTDGWKSSEGRKEGGSGGEREREKDEGSGRLEDGA